MYFVVGFEIVVKNIHTNGEVTGVEGIRSIPSLRSKLSPLHHNSMEVDKREQDTLELILLGAHLKCVLIMV